MVEDLEGLRALAEVMLASHIEEKGFPQDEAAAREFFATKGIPEEYLTHMVEGFNRIVDICRTNSTCYRIVTGLTMKLEVRPFIDPGTLDGVGPVTDPSHS